MQTILILDVTNHCVQTDVIDLTGDHDVTPDDIGKAQWAVLTAPSYSRKRESGQSALRKDQRRELQDCKEYLELQLKDLARSTHLAQIDSQVAGFHVTELVDYQKEVISDVGKLMALLDGTGTVMEAQLAKELGLLCGKFFADQDVVRRSMQRWLDRSPICGPKEVGWACRKTVEELARLGRSKLMDEILQTRLP